MFVQNFIKLNAAVHEQWRSQEFDLGGYKC